MRNSPGRTAKQPPHWLTVGFLLTAGLTIVILLYRWATQSHETQVTASIATRSVAFTVGDWQGSDGIFVHGRSPVNLTVQTECKFTKNGIQQKDTNVGQMFPGIALMRMDTSRGVRVMIDVDNGLLIFNLQKLRPSSGTLGPLGLQLTDHSSVQLTPADGDPHMEFSIRFRTDPEPEVNIPLEDASTVSFQKDGTSQVIPARTVLQGKPISGDYCGITIRKMRTASIGLKLEQKESIGPSILEDTPHTNRSDGERFYINYLTVRLGGKTSELWVEQAYGAKAQNMAPKNISIMWSNISLPFKAAGTIFTVILAFFKVFRLTQRKQVKHRAIPKGYQPARKGVRSR